MQFDSFSAFIDMGGYSFYVWLSYGVSLLLLTVLYVTSKSNHNKTKQLIAKRLKREDKLRQAAKLNAERNSSAPPKK
jgi:heme exporter protein D